MRFQVFLLCLATLEELRLDSVDLNQERSPEITELERTTSVPLQHLSFVRCTINWRALEKVLSMRSVRALEIRNSYIDDLTPTSEGLSRAISRTAHTLQELILFGQMNRCIYMDPVFLGRCEMGFHDLTHLKILRISHQPLVGFFLRGHQGPLSIEELRRIFPQSIEEWQYHCEGPSFSDKPDGLCVICPAICFLMKHKSVVTPRLRTLFIHNSGAGKLNDKHAKQMREACSAADVQLEIVKHV